MIVFEDQARFWLIVHLVLGVSVTAVATHQGWLTAVPNEMSVVLVAGAAMTGHVLLVSSLILYARYLVLDVQGLIVHSARAPQAKTKSRSDSIGPFENRSATARRRGTTRARRLGDPRIPSKNSRPY